MTDQTGSPSPDLSAEASAPERRRGLDFLAAAGAHGLASPAVLTATLLALSAAALHAVWNLLLKTTSVGDRGVASWGQFLFGALLALPALAVVGLPGTVAVPWLLGSAAIHVAYVLALVRAYGAGDFSLAYPLARGTGAMVAAMAGVLVLGDHLPPAAWGAIAVVVAGLVSLVGRTASPASVRWALLTALAIGAYTTVDAHGSRISADGAAYGLALMPITAAALSVAFVVRGRSGALVELAGRSWKRWLVAGACTTAAYTLVLIAVRSAPVGYVTMLRESSVVLGALAGWLFLHERLGGRRLASSTVILAGMVLLVAAGT